MTCQDLAWAYSELSKYAQFPGKYHMLAADHVLSYLSSIWNQMMRYRVVPGHRNWQIETAGWNCAGFFTEGLETRWQRFGQFLNNL